MLTILSTFAAPIARGSPGYRTQLDADNDGIACEGFQAESSTSAA